MKICNKCNISKNMFDFYVKKISKDGYETICKSCIKENKIAYYFNNLDKIKEYDKQNYKNKRDEKLKWQKQYYSLNKEAKLKWEKDNHNKRVKIDVNYKLKKNLRNRLYQAIKNNQKSGSAIKDLGCSIEEFKKYLESKFKLGMTWDNYGLYGWHIDHIRPLDNFNLVIESDFKEACHYTNLQPLWAEENLSKGAKYD